MLARRAALSRRYKEMAQARKPGAKISQVYRHFFYVKGGMDGKQRKKLLTLVEVCCVALLAPPIVCLFLVPAEVIRIVNLQPRRSPCYRRGPPRRTPPNEVTDEGSSSSLLSRPSSMMVSDCDVRSLCSDRDAGSDLNDQALRMHNPVPIQSLGLEPRTNCSMVRERHCSSDSR